MRLGLNEIPSKSNHHLWELCYGMAIAMEISRPLRTKLGGAIGCGSLDKIQKIIARRVWK